MIQVVQKQTSCFLKEMDGIPVWSEEGGGRAAGAPPTDLWCYHPYTCWGHSQLFGGLSLTTGLCSAGSWERPEV